MFWKAIFCFSINSFQQHGKKINFFSEDLLMVLLGFFFDGIIWLPTQTPAFSHFIYEELNMKM